MVDTGPPQNGITWDEFSWCPRQTNGIGKEGPNPGQKKTTGFGDFRLYGKDRWFVQVMSFWFAQNLQWSKDRNWLCLYLTFTTDRLEKQIYFFQVMVFTTNNFQRKDFQIFQKHFYGRYRSTMKLPCAHKKRKEISGENRFFWTRHTTSAATVSRMSRT